MVAITLEIHRGIGLELSHVFRRELHGQGRHIIVEILNLCCPRYGADIRSLVVNPCQRQLRWPAPLPYRHCIHFLKYQGILLQVFWLKPRQILKNA